MVGGVVDFVETEIDDDWITFVILPNEVLAAREPENIGEKFVIGLRGEEFVVFGVKIKTAGLFVEGCPIGDPKGIGRLNESAPEDDIAEAWGSGDEICAGDFFCHLRPDGAGGPTFHAETEDNVKAANGDENSVDAPTFLAFWWVKKDQS